MSVKASILIPVYNVEKYIIECLDSIRGQTFSDFEVILIDDGSSDRSGKICDDYAKKDSRFRVYHQKNQGVAVARENALRKAEGEYIFWCDADDYVSCDWLEMVLTTFERQNVDIVVFSYQEFESSGIRSKQIFYGDHIHNIKKNAVLNKNGFGMLWNWTAKRTLWVNEHIIANFSDDGYVVARIFLKTQKICEISDILYNYRRDNSYSLRHTLSFIGFKDVNMWEYRLQQCRKYFPEEESFCLGKLLHNLVRSYSLAVVFRNLTGREMKKAVKLLKEENFTEVKGYWKDKGLRWCILNQHFIPCLWYAKYKIWKQGQKMGKRELQ